MKSPWAKAALLAAAVTIVAGTLWRLPADPVGAARAWTVHINRPQNFLNPRVALVDQFTDADWQHLFREVLRPDTALESRLMACWQRLPWSIKRWVPRPRDYGSRQYALSRAWQSSLILPDERRRQLLRAILEPGTKNQRYALALALDRRSPAAIMLPELLQLAAKGDPAITNDAVIALQNVVLIDDPQSREMLIRLAREADHDLRAIARLVLQRPRPRQEVSLDDILPPAQFDPDAQEIQQPVGLW
jgi:hypothetical protein